MSHPFRALISPLQTQCDLVRIAFIIIATKLHAAKDDERGAEIFRVTKKAVFFAETAFYMFRQKRAWGTRRKNETSGNMKRNLSGKRLCREKLRIVPFDNSKIGVISAKLGEIERNLQEISEKTMAL